MMRISDLLQIIELIILVVIMSLMLSGKNDVQLINQTDTVVVKSDTFKLAVDSAYYTIEKINYVD